MNYTTIWVVKDASSNEILGIYSSRDKAIEASATISEKLSENFKIEMTQFILDGPPNLIS